jgi:DNA-binding winged helix-turn-helix (wHTH) protein
MDHERYLTFGPFRLDVAHGRVWRGEQVTALRPRSVAMLRYLVEHPRHLVTKAELRQHVWGGTHVTDIVLRVCVKRFGRRCATRRRRRVTSKRSNGRAIGCSSEETWRSPQR